MFTKVNESRSVEVKAKVVRDDCGSNQGFTKWVLKLTDSAELLFHPTDQSRLTAVVKSLDQVILEYWIEKIIFLIFPHVLIKDRAIILHDECCCNMGIKPHDLGAISTAIP